ncbi:cell division control protein 48-like [Pyrus ussuriensis x Pyrus communis]|uniref:Cell division control protein 48-like n=1 Tax=Pyrus ussuriensis x Pyrus communis TaxID=2448454 RepID=A0A5N5HIX5_9ROSA|nr:cell division control protein 48-like [Pyrus ussuriensis x Pyrus communis]
MQVSGVIGGVSLSIPSGGDLRWPVFGHFHDHVDNHSHPLVDSKSFLSAAFFFQKLSIILHLKAGNGLYNCRARGLIVRALKDSSDNFVPLLAQILQTHPHLLLAAIDQQHIAEVKEKERCMALEEIIYCLIVHKFIDKEISNDPEDIRDLIPLADLSFMSPYGSPCSIIHILTTVDFWPNLENKIESIHSPEAYEMIQSHLSLVLSERLVGPLSSLVEISKIKLERTINTLSKGGSDNDGGGFMDNGKGKSYRLRSYVMYLDADTLQRYTTIRSKEAISLINKQTQALFRTLDIRIAKDGLIYSSNDEVIALTFSGLTMLIWEAIVFESFL